MEKVKKSDFAPLMLDEETANLLNAVFYYADKSEEFHKWIDKKGVEPKLLAFFKDFNVKFHEHDWCNDPFCRYNEKDNK